MSSSQTWIECKYLHIYIYTCNTCIHIYIYIYTSHLSIIPQQITKKKTTFPGSARSRTLEVGPTIKHLYHPWISPSQDVSKKHQKKHKMMQGFRANQIIYIVLEPQGQPVKNGCLVISNHFLCKDWESSN